MSRVSAVIVNFNGGGLLARSVTSALENVDEVILVDNHSDDQSVENCIRRFPAEERLKIIKNGANLGFAAACNIGSAEASGEYLLFLNPDCVIGEHAVAELVKEMVSRPDVAMAGGVLLNPDGSEQGGARRAVPTPWRSFVRAFGLNRYSARWPKLFFDFHLHKQPLPDRPIEVEAISGACMLVSRAAMDGVGYWDESYFLHCEDLDLCMRLRIQGKKILFVPSARFLHYQGTCSAARPVFVEWHKHKGMVRFYRKFFRNQYPGLLMWMVILGVWARFCAVAIIKTIRRLRGR